MANYGVTPIVEMRESFPAKPPAGEGKPDLHRLLDALRHIVDCAMTHRTPGQPLGKLYLAVRAPSYALHTAQPYPQREADPGHAETYIPGMDAAQRNNVKNAFTRRYKRHHDENNRDHGLIE